MGVQARCCSGDEIIEDKLTGGAALRCWFFEGLHSLWVGLFRALRSLQPTCEKLSRMRRPSRISSLHPGSRYAKVVLPCNQRDCG